MIPFVTEPPRSVCILRLSAIGDTCHVVPIVRTLQHAWPATQLTWIIGKSEARLMSLIEGVEFITVDKRARLRRPPRRCAAGCAGAASMCCCTCSCRCAPAWRRGPCRRASRSASTARAPASCSGCSPTRKSAPRVREHVLDSFFGFPAALGRARAPAALGRAAAAGRARVRAAADPGGAADARHQSLLEPHAAQLASPSATRRWPSTPSGATACASSWPAARASSSGDTGAADRGGLPRAAAPTRSVRTRCRSCWRCWRAPPCSSARTQDRRTWPPWSARR